MQRRAYPHALWGGILPRMNSPTPQRTPKTQITTPRGAQPPRMRAPLRKAIDLIVLKGKSQRDAAEEAGMNETALSRALQKPHIRNYLDEQKALFCLDADKLKPFAKALAMQTGMDLMLNSKSDQVKARMVEFFAGEARGGAQVNVQVNVDRNGYEYVKPGQRLVDITPATDHASEGDDVQGTDPQGD